MAIYKLKDIKVEAIQYLQDNLEQILAFGSKKVLLNEGFTYITIDAPGTRYLADIGDFLVKHENGNITVSSEEEFHETFDLCP